MRTVGILLILLLTVSWQTTVNSAETIVKFDAASPTKGIQEAIDKCIAQGGGTVFIPRGKYIISQPITIARIPDKHFLESGGSKIANAYLGYTEKWVGNIIIRGEGPCSIIETEAEYSVQLSADTIKDSYTVKLKTPGKFKKGDAIIITDKKHPYNSQANVIKEIKGNTISLATAVNDVFRKDADSRIIHSYNIIIHRTRRIIGVTIKDLCLKGSLNKNFQGVMNYNFNSGIGINGSALTVTDCEFYNIPADGIICGVGAHLSIRNCRFKNIGQRGIHLGGNPKNVNIIGNTITDCGLFGIYFCHGCQRVNVVSNVISGIGRYNTDKGKITSKAWNGKYFVAGIGGLGAGGKRDIDQDKYCNINSNIIHDSDGVGIDFWKWGLEKNSHPGEVMTITGNTIYNIKEYGISISYAQCLNVFGNTISESKYGIAFHESHDCLFSGNILRSCKTAFELSSKEEKYPVENNVITGNLLVKCSEKIEKGRNVGENIIENNHMFEKKNSDSGVFQTK